MTSVSPERDSPSSYLVLSQIQLSFCKKKKNIVSLLLDVRTDCFVNIASVAVLAFAKGQGYLEKTTLH
jgi:hypothetical protein